MHPKINSLNPEKTYPGNTPDNRWFWLLVCGLLLSSCAGTPVGRNVQVEDRTVVRDWVEPAPSGEIENGDRSTPLDERNYRIERAEYYEQLADRTGPGSVAESIDAALSAAEFYIQANDTQQASQSIAELDTRQFNQDQRNRYQIVIAYIEYARGEYRVALNRLGVIVASTLTAVSNDDSHTPDQQFETRQPFDNRQVVDALLLSSFCHQALGDYDSAIAALVEREALLAGAARAETSRYIWQVINGLSLAQRQGIIQNTANLAVRNRFEQSLQGQVGATADAPNQFDQWRDHSQAGPQSLVASEWSAASPRTIAVLLPLTSRFTKAALAVKDGIEYQHALNSSPYRPRLEFYDIGDNFLQVSQYYEAARQNGAEFVIGPLGMEYANQLNQYLSESAPETNARYAGGATNLPTVLLGGDQSLSRNISRLTISPERQAVIVAERALALGYVNAALLVPDDESGARTAETFTRYWLGRGGKLSQTVVYASTQFDHSTELKQLFNINYSEYRHKQLSNTLGYKPGFAPYRRNDIDFIFMIADNNSGRIVRPQINFFSGVRLPVLATASVYNGIQDPTNNVDLDQTAFPVMPWVLRSTDVSPYAGQLNMLFAMGMDTYQLAPVFRSMQQNPEVTVEGNTGRLSVESSGEVLYRPVWAEFSNGLAETNSQIIPVDESMLAPWDTEPGDQPGQQQGGESYDESNWDPRQSRRKTGS